MQIGCTCLKCKAVNEPGESGRQRFTLHCTLYGAGTVPSALQHTQQWKTNLVEENTQAYILVDYGKSSLIHSMSQETAITESLMQFGTGFDQERKKSATLLKCMMLRLTRTILYTEPKIVS